MLEMGTDDMAGCPGQDSDLPECDCDINRQEIYIHLSFTYYNLHILQMYEIFQCSAGICSVLYLVFYVILRHVTNGEVPEMRFISLCG